MVQINYIDVEFINMAECQFETLKRVYFAKFPEQIGVAYFELFDDGCAQAIVNNAQQALALQEIAETL